VIVPIYYKETDKEKILKKAEEMKEKLEKENLKVILDDRTEYTPGWKFNEWELKGVPIRIEIGPKDIQKKQVVIVRRDNFEKMFVKDKDVIKKIIKSLDEIQKNLLNKAKKFLNEHITTVKTFDEFKKVLDNKSGFLRACHCLEQGCEEKIKGETGATIRTIPFKKEKTFSNCIYCNKKAKEVVYFAKAY
jgi:prolyl-tRNA synthetase